MIREITKKENTQVRRHLNNWGVFDYFKNKSFIIKENSDNLKTLCMISENLKDLIFFPHTYSSGIGLGILTSRNFFPLPAFLYFITKYSNSFPYIAVNEESENLVLYGRDIFGESIIETSENIKENSMVLILNKGKEPLGIGKTRFSLSRIKEKDMITVKTLLDLGMYLRDENKLD